MSENKEKRQKIKTLKKVNGITLIALVITIIVLLILAGVSIATLTGENGILTRANEAKEKTEAASKEEQIALQKIAEEMDKITQVKDEEPGKLEGEGSSQNPYIINSIEDLVVFAHEVTNGRTFIKEDGTKEYVELGQSLDFQSDKSYVNPEREDYAEYGYSGKLKETINTNGFIPIGILSHKYAENSDARNNAFNGEFNGNGYTIYNLKIEQNLSDYDSYFFTGLFSLNYGSIKNLIIENGINNSNISSGNFDGVALMVGTNRGEIINCAISGEVNSTEKLIYSGNVGGLVGSNSGNIKYCSNLAKIQLTCKDGEVQSVRETRVGGLVGVNEEKGVIENSYNTGDIISEIIDNESIVTSYMGGIAGKNNGKINNSYSIGKLSNVDETNLTNFIMGEITGINNTAIYNSEITNCYYLNDILNPSGDNVTITTEGEEKTSEAMKQNSFVDELNEGNETSIWKINSNTNQGYPILYWQ